MRSVSRRTSLLTFVAAAALATALAGARAQEATDLDGAADMGLRPGADTAPAAASIDAAPDAGAIDPQDDKLKKKREKARRDAARLPPLTVYGKAQRQGLRGGPPLDPVTDPPMVPGPTVAVIPGPPPRRKIPVEENPYDPLGIRVGDLKLTPYVEEDVGYASNPALVAGAIKGSLFETTEVGTEIKSDWSRNELHGELKGGYTDDFAVPNQSAPYGSGVLGGRYDISKDLSLDAEGRFSLATESLASLGLANGSSNSGANPQVSTYGGTVGGAQKFGDLTLALHGSLDRTAYQDVDLGAGSVDRLSQNDYDDWGLKGRVSYRLTDAVSPFLEFGFDTRRYDSTINSTGYAQDSRGYTGTVGLTLAYSQKLTGEASVGYSQRSYQDARLPNAQAPLFNAALIWSMTPLTTITLKAQSSIADAVTAGASADITRSYTIDLSHSLTRAITLGASAGYQTDNYVGVSEHDSTTSFGLKAEYHVSRELVFKASATRQQFVSNAANSNYNADVFLLGVRLQD